MTSQFRRERHSVTDLKIHLVCVTKYRMSVFTSESLELIKNSFNEVAKKMDFEVIEFNGEDNHVHALIEYPPKLSISQIVNALKGVSSRRYGQAGYIKPHKAARVCRGILPRQHAQLYGVPVILLYPLEVRQLKY